jgi:CheY-like chemotaxis protein
MISMLKSTPIVFIDDDVEEHETFTKTLASINVRSEVRFFTRCDDAFDYLKTTTDSPFLIFCDVHMPRKNGIDFKKQVDQDKQLRKKSIPFVFYTAAARLDDINDAYKHTIIQGFFEKQNDVEETKHLLKLIIEYWYHSKHPNSIQQATTLRNDD